MSDARHGVPDWEAEFAAVRTEAEWSTLVADHMDACQTCSTSTDACPALAEIAPRRLREIRAMPAVQILSRESWIGWYVIHLGLLPIVLNLLGDHR